MTTVRRSRPRLSEGFLALARREVLGLVIALQRDDAGELALAELRLRSALSRLEELIASTLQAGDVEAYERLRHLANLHLPSSPGVQLTPEQLPVVIAKVRAESPLASVNADGLVLCDLDLDDIVLRSMTLRGATITCVDARGADLSNVLAMQARISISCFDSASLATAFLDGANIWDTDFNMADLTCSSWRTALVVGCVFNHAVMASTTLTGAGFETCSFLNASFRRPWGVHPEGMAGTRFAGCDLRLTDWSGCDVSGVTFVDCKMRGMRGMVRGLELAKIERPIVGDVDTAADTNTEKVGTRDDVLRMWPQS
jgi:uncharacterized protein YjbI with pentapeptide repeats